MRVEYEHWIANATKFAMAVEDDRRRLREEAQVEIDGVRASYKRKLAKEGSLRRSIYEAAQENLRRMQQEFEGRVALAEGRATLAEDSLRRALEDAASARTASAAEREQALAACKDGQTEGDVLRREREQLTQEVERVRQESERSLAEVKERAECLARQLQQAQLDVESARAASAAELEQALAVCRDAQTERDVFRTELEQLTEEVERARQGYERNLAEAEKRAGILAHQLQQAQLDATSARAASAAELERALAACKDAQAEGNVLRDGYEQLTQVREEHKRNWADAEERAGDLARQLQQAQLEATLNAGKLEESRAEAARFRHELDQVKETLYEERAFRERQLGLGGSEMDIDGDALLAVENRGPDGGSGNQGPAGGSGNQFANKGPAGGSKNQGPARASKNQGPARGSRNQGQAGGSGSQFANQGPAGGSGKQCANQGPAGGSGNEFVNAGQRKAAEKSRVVDLIRLFIEEHCITGGPSLRVSSHEFREGLLRATAESDWYLLGERQIGILLQKPLGFKPLENIVDRDGKRRRGFLGVALKPTAALERSNGA